MGGGVIAVDRSADGVRLGFTRERGAAGCACDRAGLEAGGLAAPSPKLEATMAGGSDGIRGLMSVVAAGRGGVCQRGLTSSGAAFVGLGTMDLQSRVKNEAP